VTTPGEPELHVVTVPQLDPRLGRQVVHDPRSRSFPFRAAEAPRKDITLRVYNPRPLPAQVIGCCTGVDACVKANTAGNRVKGVVLDMDNAVRIYSRATQLDPWTGSYPPTDTGSSGLAACKASAERGLILRYEWIFNGVDGIHAALATGKPVGVGTYWYNSMFKTDAATGLVEVSGAKAGGHQYTIIGYRKRFDAFLGLCWWGAWGYQNTGRFLIRRTALADLLADDGDAHITVRAMGS
jgi:hypothetical protein